MTDYAEVNTAVESMKLGSIDYIPKQLVEDKLVPPDPFHTERTSGRTTPYAYIRP